MTALGHQIIQSGLGQTAGQPGAKPIRMLLTKHNIPILNGDFVLPKIKDMNIRQTLADLSPEPPASLISKPAPSNNRPLVLSDMRRSQNSGIKFVQLVLEQPKPEPAPATPLSHNLLPVQEPVQIKTEKFCKTETRDFGNNDVTENICTICGETVPEKSAFNAHIKAHLKEKLKKRSQLIKTEQTDPEDKRSQPVKRKLPSSSLDHLHQPSRVKIKLETLEPVIVPEMDTPSPEVSSIVDDSFLGPDLTQDFTTEIESQPVELNNDISMILDQIEKDFDSGPGSNMTDVNLDTPPESDNDSDIFNFLQSDDDISSSSMNEMVMVPPRLAESSSISDDIENLLNQTASDHDYLLNTTPAPSSSPAPSNDTNRISPESNISKVLISTSTSESTSSQKTFAIVNHTTGKVFIQREGAPAKTLSMIKPSESASAAAPIKIENFHNKVAPMTNAKIIETTKGNDGEKEYKIVLGTDKESLKSKIKSKQTADCNICGKSITTKNMARHMEKHTGKKKFQCNICHASFFQKTHLKNHIVLHENGECHQCQECKQKFLRKTDLQKHCKTVHGGELLSNVNCSTCGLKFAEQQSLEVHYKNSHCTAAAAWEDSDKKELCGLCGEKFKDKEAMIVHMQTHHTSPSVTDSKPYSCTICQKTFVQKGHLNRHFKNHQADTTGDLKQCKSRQEGAEQRSTFGSVLMESDATNQRSVSSASDFMSLLSPGSLSSHDFEFFEEESNSSTIFSQSPIGFFPPSTSFNSNIPTYSESTRIDSLEDNFCSFLNDFDSDSPLINDSISGDKSFSTSVEDTRPNLTFDDISDASFFDISSQLDENIYDADLFSTMK